MKFSTFFGKYTICTLIYSAISFLIGIAGFGVLYHIGKKAEEKDDEEKSDHCFRHEPGQ